MLMKNHTSDSIMKDAGIYVLFESDMFSGYLYQEQVFIEISSDEIKPSGIYITDESARDLVPKALYLVECLIDSLGFDVKNDKMLTQEIIEKKVFDAYAANLPISVSDFTIAEEGIEVFPIADLEPETVNEVTTDETPETDQIEEASEFEQSATDVSAKKSLTGFSEKIKQRRAASAPAEETIEVVTGATEAPTEETTVSASTEITEPVAAETETETETVPEPSVAAVTAPAELSRSEKKEIGKQKLMTLITDKSKVYLTKDLFHQLKEIVDFPVSSTDTKNYLIDLMTDGKLETTGKPNQFQLPAFEQISFFEEPTEEAPKTSSKAPAAPVSAPVAQTPAPAQTTPAAPAPAPFVTVDEELKTAETFPPLFDNDEEVLEYFEMFNLPNRLLDWAMQFRAHNRERFRNAPQMVVDVIPQELSYLGKGSVIVKALTALKADLPLSLKGDAGTGKTTVVETLCAALNMPLFTINGSLESNKATLIGEPTIKQQGIITIKDGQMQKAAQYGGVFYIDEINMMRPDILGMAHGFLDHRKSFQNDVRSQMVFAHKDTRFISAMNEGYEGTKKMNKATNDRHVAIRLSYMTKKELKVVLDKVLQKTEEVEYMSLAQRDKLVENVASLYNILSAKAENKLVPDLSGSTRSIIQLMKMAAILEDFDLAIEMIFDKFTPEEISAIKGALMNTGIEDQLGITFKI